MKNILKWFTISFFSSILLGCTSTYFLKLEPQTHFTYPDSTITRLGRVNGQASRSSFLFFGNLDIDSQLKLDAINNALSKKPGAELIINPAYFLSITSYLLGTKMVYQVDGQAAKADIGKRELEENPQ